MFVTLPDGTCKPGDEYEVGTEYATPLVSGTIALMLEQNPALTWLDVQNILARTSDKIDAGDESWATNGAGLSHSYLYGFGQVNAYKAVGMARNFSEAGAGLPQVSLSHARKPGLIIADGASASDTISVGDGERAAARCAARDGLHHDRDGKPRQPRGQPHLALGCRQRARDRAASDGVLGGVRVRVRRRFGLRLRIRQLEIHDAARLGENATGDWTLNVVDTLDGGGDSQLVKWSVVLFGQGPKGGGGGGGGGLAWWVWGLVGVGSFARARGRGVLPQGPPEEGRGRRGYLRAEQPGGGQVGDRLKSAAGEHAI